VIVADASSIISFARADKLELLKQVVQNLIIPEGVYGEIVLKGRGKPGAFEVNAAPWIKVKKIDDRMKLTTLPDKLGQGEKEAILLAQEMEAFLLMDDPQARKEAKDRKIRLVSSADILQEAKDQNLIPNVRKSLDDLIGAGFRISDRLYRDILHRAKEE
jgi:predicted nucleic acid-binding protein